MSPNKKSNQDFKERVKKCFIEASKDITVASAALLLYALFRYENYIKKSNKNIF